MMCQSLVGMSSQIQPSPKLAGPDAANNIYFVSGFSSLKPANDKTEAFIKHYKAKYGEERLLTLLAPMMP